MGRLLGLTGAAALAAIAWPASAQDLIGLVRAIGVAERSLSARAIEGELETSGGRPVYEIDLVRGQVLHRALVDARTGKLVSAQTPRAENWLRGWFDKDRLHRGGRAAPLSEHLVALERRSRGEIKEVEFEIHQGRAVYEIELATAQAVSNLLDNAIRYTPRGGEIVLSGQDEGAALSIAVRDTGPGIAEGDLPHVTERFYRAKNGAGTGIGLGLSLSLVEAIARLHRSTLGFVNLDRGLRVDWRFPV